MRIQPKTMFAFDSPKRCWLLGFCVAERPSDQEGANKVRRALAIAELHKLLSECPIVTWCMGTPGGPSDCTSARHRAFPIIGVNVVAYVAHRDAEVEITPILNYLVRLCEERDIPLSALFVWDTASGTMVATSFQVSNGAPSQEVGTFNFQDVRANGGEIADASADAARRVFGGNCGESVRRDDADDDVPPLTGRGGRC